jgi:chloramphenicol-sensitive protein RarD
MDEKGGQGSKTDREDESRPNPDAGVGVACGMTAFLIWGLSPLYWKALAAVPAFEILMHRMVWSFVFLVPILVVMGGWGDLLAALRRPRTVGVLCLTTVVVATNWFVFIWAINHDQVLQTSLGYYINPLVNVMLGMVVLKERLRRLQWIAVGLAGVAVTGLTVFYGQFPGIALWLALTFGCYGLIRKMAAVGALVGLTVETFLLSVPAAGYLVYLDRAGAGAFYRDGPATSFLLMGAALVTALPLLLFTLGAKRIHFSTVGFLQYLAPSCSFLLAVFVFGEPIAPAQLIAFALIWTALGLYTADSVRVYRRAARRLETPRAGKAG